jgi:hypothetical protein
VPDEGGRIGFERGRDTQYCQPQTGLHESIEISKYDLFLVITKKTTERKASTKQARRIGFGRHAATRICKPRAGLHKFDTNSKSDICKPQPQRGAKSRIRATFDHIILLTTACFARSVKTQCTISQLAFEVTPLLFFFFWFDGDEWRCSIRALVVRIVLCDS